MDLGYRSPARTILSGLRDALRPSGLSAFRFLVPIEKLAPYPEMAEIIDWTKQMTHVWYVSPSTPSIPELTDVFEIGLDQAPTHCATPSVKERC